MVIKSVSVSIATIPPRYKNGTLQLFINSMLKQTYPINNIYINIPCNFKRFDNFTHDEICDIKSMSDKIVISYNELDSPLIKHIGSIDLIDDDEILFIGDDDQEYHPELIKHMVDGMYDDSAVYQNRYHIVKHGTAGIIHGFVGLMYKKALLNNYEHFKLPPGNIWTDDQLMSIYFFKNNISINPSPINDFDDIYSHLNINGMEKLGTGGDLCLSDETNKRSEEIKQLEIFYNVHFHLKEKDNSKGKIYNYDYTKQLNIILVSLKPVEKTKLTAVNDFLESNKHLNIKLHLYSNTEYYNKYNEFNMDVKDLPEHMLKYYEDKIGINAANELNGIYINMDYELNDINLLDLYFSNNNLYKKNDKILYISNSL